jgi:hypothetical protein
MRTPVHRRTYSCIHAALQRCCCNWARERQYHDVIRKKIALHLRKPIYSSHHLGALRTASHMVLQWQIIHDFVSTCRKSFELEARAHSKTRARVVLCKHLKRGSYVTSILMPQRQVFNITSTTPKHTIKHTCKSQSHTLGPGTFFIFSIL